MSISKELESSIKDFLNISNIPIQEAIYLETGLAGGDSVQEIINLNFKKIISIEIDQKAIDKAKIRFKNEIAQSKVILIQGDSEKKIKETFNQNINIIFLDAHGSEFDTDTNAPLEGEINYLVNKINEKQLIIIDDFINIRNSFFFSDFQDWKRKFKFSKLKEILSGKDLKTFEMFHNNGLNSYLLITKNKYFKIDKKFYLKLLFLKVLSIKFYLTHLQYLIKRYIKKSIILLTSESFFNKIKKFLNRK